MVDRPEERRETERRTEWLRAEIQSMREEHRDAHQRLRSDMHAEFTRMRQEVLMQHATTLKELGERVLVIETQRDMDAKHAARWGVGAAAVISALVEMLRQKLNG